MTKPPQCAACPFVKGSTGFCADFVPARPKIAVVLKMPGKQEVVTGTPMSGGAGHYWWKEFMWPQGLRKEDVLIANVIRCYPNGNEFPIGKLRVLATQTCALNWDDDLKKFDPNIFGVSVNPAALLRNPQQTKFLKRAIHRAVELANEGYRPCLLLGEEAKAKFAPWLEGGMKQWQGHWFENKLT
jgi:hypothetical protein